MPTLDTPDTSLHYEQAGSGAPILLIQGVGVTGSGWQPQLADLADGFETLVFDNRGIGRSRPCRGRISIEAMAADALALLKACGWASAHVVGHSMGGIIAQQLALDAPQRVRSLSLICTFARAKDAARLTPWVLWMTLRTRLGTRRMRRRAFLEMLLPPDRATSEDPDALAVNWMPILGRDLADQPPIILRQVRALSRHDTSARLGELAGIPTWVLSADLDPIAAPRYGVALAKAIPGAHHLQLPAASHAVTLHDPERVNAPLREFLVHSEAAWQARLAPTRG